MDPRSALHELTKQHALSPTAAARLRALSGLDQEPEQLSRVVPMGVAVTGAALGGLGIVFWIAANWDALSRSGKFALLQGLILATCAGAAFRPGARVPLGLVSFMAIGGLFAYFGQTYQTGADPWQLFALWAGLSLPLCLALRHDALWAPWALVAMTCVSLWVHAHLGRSWDLSAGNAIHLVGWIAGIGLTVGLSPALRRFTGAGPWAMRTALVLTVIVVTMTALITLFSDQPGQYLFAVCLMAGAALLFGTTLYDTFCLSAIGLSLNALLVAGLAKLMFGDGNEQMFPMLILGLCASASLALTVKLILQQAKRYAQGDQA